LTVLPAALRYVYPADLAQKGNPDLVRAVKPFDWRLGYRFSTYALWRVHKAAGRCLERHWPGFAAAQHAVQQLNRLGLPASRRWSPTRRWRAGT